MVRKVIPRGVTCRAKLGWSLTGLCRKCFHPVTIASVMTLCRSLWFLNQLHLYVLEGTKQGSFRKLGL